MSHGLDVIPGRQPAVPDNPLLARCSALLDKLNHGLMILSMLALILTALVLTYAVISRYFFRAPTDWQDEASVFMLVGATFCCTGYVQGLRGHIGIDAMAALLSARANAIRAFIVDLLSLAFCTFFTWKSWSMWHEAWRDGQTTSSTFAPPLWIPYGMMAFGMTILSLQLLVQVTTFITNKRSAA